MSRSVPELLTGGRRRWMSTALLCAALLATSAHPMLAGVNVWTSRGPGTISVATLAINPTTPRTLYAGTGGGGVLSIQQVVCVGDCDASGSVTVDEILTLVNMALGNGGTCLSGLVAGVTPDVSVILQAVNNALNGCSPPTPTATPSPTATPVPNAPTMTYTLTPTGTATATNTPTPNPAAYLKLDDPTGATTFADSSGSNHPGSCSDGACPTLGVAGEFGTAAFFSTSGSGAYVVDIPNLSPTPGTFSYILWVKTSGSAGTAGTMGLIHIGSVASDWSDHLVLDHGTPRVDIWNGSVTKTAWAAAAVQNNAWYCVAATSNANGSINVYLNGTQGSSVAVGGDSNSLPSDVHLGMQSSGPGAFGTGYFYGTMDEVRIYPFELSASEISTLCATPTPAPTP